jgi:hypothetical protein
LDFNDYLNSLQEAFPPQRVSVYLQALWYHRKGDWNKAHQIVQDIPDEKASWIHAFLHREEGDIWNADYWYRRAHQKRPESSITEEWTFIVKTLL